MTDPLTSQQERIALYAAQGYPAPQIARIIECSPSLVFDQVRLIRKKQPLALAKAADARIPLPGIIR